MTTLHLSIATSGLPGATKSVWCPRMCAALCDDAGNVTDSFSVNVRADGRHIEAAAVRRHGITTAEANRTGIDELFALSSICGLRATGKRTQDRPGLISCARILVAWDAAFVAEVLSGLYARHGEPQPSTAWRRPGLTIVGLQEISRQWCRLPCPEGDDSGQYKSPTRDEAAAFFCEAAPRALPNTVDDNLRLERAIYAALLERKAFERAA